jgi:ribosomal protein S18 acetylase RimI-like enzyme
VVKYFQLPDHTAAIISEDFRKKVFPMNIRRAQSRDIPGILSLLAQVNLVHHLGRPDLFKKHTKYSREDLEQMLPDDSRPIFVGVSEDTGEVLGYGFCIFQQAVNDSILTDVKTLYIDDICVDEKARGHHVATEIFQYIREFARSSGVYHITLNVWELNDGARHFYEAMGMKPMRTTMETIL